MTIYRSFQLTVVLDLLTYNLIVNPTLVISGTLQSAPDNLLILSPGQEAIWNVQTTDYNEGIRFIAQLTGPTSPVPFSIECGVPVFGKAFSFVRNLPEGLNCTIGGSVLSGLYAVYVANITHTTTQTTGLHPGFLL